MFSSKEDTFIIWLALLGCCLSCTAQTNDGTNTPFLPSAWPLAVKGPYLNSWESGGGPGKGFLPFSVPAFWFAFDATTWTCNVVVDDVPYRIMGVGLPSGPPNVTLADQTAVDFTATRTTFSFTAGPVNINATFLSPVTPTDLMRQSIPFSYFYLDISSKDGEVHDLRVYSDIFPQWLHCCGSTTNVNVNASLIDSNDFVGLQMQFQNPQPFFEVANQAQDVTGVFAMKSKSGIRYQVGPTVDVRSLGINSTGLQNTIDANYSSHVLDNPFDAFAISLDLGSIERTSEPIMWTIGMLRDPSINLTTASGSIELRSSYYWSNFSTIADIVSFVLDDFDSALSSADAFDQMIQNVSLSHITGYSDLLSLAARQIFGSLEITVSKSSDGKWNQSDVAIFRNNLGDVGSTGTSGGTNIVDVLYAGFPAILFLNPELGRYLLQPILESQISNGVLVGQAYAPQNMGSQFPNTSSCTSSHNLGVEQSGNMIIMVLAHLQKTKDLSIVQNYYPLLKSWADYLVNQTLNAGYQTSSLSDGITSFNQTNLVLKGIIGISAMSSISSAMKEGTDQMRYQATAQQYLQVWLTGALSQDHSHLLSSFGNQDSSGLIYNMYADRLLGLDLIPPNITSIQSGFYGALLSANKTPYGIPLDSANSSLSRLDWTMFTIASMLDDGGTNAPAVLQPSISMLTSYAASRSNNTPLAIIYNPKTGIQYSGINSFAVGSLFAPLVMGNKSSFSTTPSGEDTSGHKSIVTPIVDGVVGGLSALLVSLLGLWTWKRRSRRTSAFALGDQDPGARLRDLAPPPSPQAEALISPYFTEAASETDTPLHRPLFVTQREKFAPPDWETVDDSELNSVSGFSDANSSYGVPRPSSRDRLEGRLADLIFEIQRVRDAVQNRNIDVHDDGMTEVPPSYTDESARAL